MSDDHLRPDERFSHMSMDDLDAMVSEFVRQGPDSLHKSDREFLKDLANEIALRKKKAIHETRLDREGRDVSDLPGLWDDDDTFEKASVTT